MGSKPLPQRLLHAGRTVLKQSYNAGRSWSRFAWPKVTSIEFLTFLIAFGTLVMAVVTYWNQQDAHEQVQILKRQVQFNSIETRPFLRGKPSISPGKPFRVVLGVTNVGKIPARVIGYDMVIQVGPKVIEPKGGTFNVQDVLYPDQPGLGVFQTLTDAEASPFTKGLEPIVTGGCVIYESISADDTRRWRVWVAYRFDQVDQPLGLVANEVDVPLETYKCDAGSLRDEWLSQLKVYPK